MSILLATFLVYPIGAVLTLIAAAFLLLGSKKLLLTLVLGLPLFGMAFTNRLTAILAGFGTGLQNDTLYLSQGISLSTTSVQTNTLSGFSPTLSKGYIRIKVYGAGGTSPTLLNLQVTLSDGTTFVNVFNAIPVVASAIVLSTTAASGSPYTNGGSNTNPGGFDFVIPFEVDINVTQLSVLTTLGGTTPTAKLDVEINGTV